MLPSYHPYATMLPSYHPYQALAEAEEMLVKCHALCDPTGL